MYVVATCSQLAAQTVSTVQREKYEDVLQGLIDFDKLSASMLPGTPYRARIAFGGAIFSTHFSGQIPIIRRSGHLTHGYNIGHPNAPLDEAARRSRYSWLHGLKRENQPADTHLTSRVFEPNVPVSDIHVGQGTVVIKFTNSQFVFGFDLEPVGKAGLVPPIVKVRIFDIEGTQVERDITLVDFGRYTIATSDQSRKITGVEFVSYGGAPFAIDNVVFQLPLAFS